MVPSNVSLQTCIRFIGFSYGPKTRGTDPLYKIEKETATKFEDRKRDYLRRYRREPGGNVHLDGGGGSYVPFKTDFN